jgi:class 3 adenylate cyclase
MERKLAAILAADVVGYSTLMEADEKGTHERLTAGRKELFEPEIARHHGRVFSPAAVGATDRVVRSTSRTPRCSSRLRTISLTRGGDKASCLAALVKLFSSTTATKAVVSARLGVCIGMPIILKNGIAHEDYSILPITPRESIFTNETHGQGEP